MLTILQIWPTVDPMAEKYYSISPYAYCAGNPILLIDPMDLNGSIIPKMGKVIQIGIGEMKVNIIQE